MNSDEIVKKSDKSQDKIDAAVKKALLTHSVSLLDLSYKLDISPRRIEESTARLRAAGHNLKLGDDLVSIQKSIAEGAKLTIDSKTLFDGKWHTFGVCTDQHLASRYARLDVLRAIYDIYEREGVRKVFCAGNLIDGECRFNRHDLLVKAGLGPQLEYLAQEYPHKKGIETLFITGDDHEGWYIQREGLNVGKMMQVAAQDAGREDLKYIGHMECDVRLQAKGGAAWLRIMHPGGGSAYAVSYTEQKIVESFQGGEKPHVLVLGHYHKFNQGYPREVHTIQGGCVQDQTPFMRKKKIQAHVGACIVRYHQSDDGAINRLSVELLPFYDRSFYEKTEKYKRW